MNLRSHPYESYRPSNSEWVDQTPAEWEETRVKDLFRLVTDKAPVDNDHELLSLYASIGVRPRKDLEARGNKASSTDGYWLVKKGDIVVNKLLAWMGSVGLSEYDGVTSPAYDVLRKTSKLVDVRYFSYLFRTEIAKQIFKRNSRGIMDMRLRLYFDKLGAISVPVPPFSTQQAIATYIDTKTRQIDRQIDLLGQKATQYGKLKQSLINEAVTRGLDKSAPMKDSGVTWIGQMPEHWELKRIKEVCDINKNTLTEKTPASYEFDYVDIGSVTYGVREYTKERMTFDAAPSRAKRIVQKGDTIISTVRTYLKAIATIDTEVVDLIVSTGFAVISPRKKIADRYCSYLLTSNCIVDEICALSNGVSYPATNATVIGDLFFLIPPLAEQVSIGAYLDDKTAQIDRTVTAIGSHIDKLKDLRKALINDVVTGKIKVVSEGQAV
ncbi:restriction endonuclease subunit S [Undibacterium sp. RuRC25W]|uniref:restriction endonuclease subunit S n=1 Tax=Undibacterium sp. RuRC25W TaxID=3413047 RepID=UPI003BF37E24